MSVTLEDLLDRIWFGAQNTVEKGASFEHLIASYLRTAIRGRLPVAGLARAWQPG